VNTCNDLLGIAFDFSGKEKMVRIAPFIPDNLTFARGKVYTLFGEVSSRWVRKPGGMDQGCSAWRR
jgi:hypothetical protein